MNLAAFYHSGMYPEIYAPDRFHLRFSFRAASGDIETCTLVYFHKNHREETTKEERMSEQYHLGTSVGEQLKNVRIPAFSNMHMPISVL